MKVHLISLGCAKNRVDSEKILAVLGLNNAIIVHYPQDSDVIIINTCGFIKTALKETIQTIRTMERIVRKTGARLIVYGCAVSRKNALNKKDFPLVWSWYGLEKCQDMLAGLNSQTMGNGNTRLLTTSGYAYIKIADGCSNHCSYCTIPQIKGPYKSRSITDIIAEANELACAGIRELILIAQDTTAYGHDLYGRKNLHTLLDKLCNIKQIKWIRILYAHPNSLYEEVIKRIENQPKICKYIDLPLQHISDRILKLMNRKTNRKQIERTVKRLHKIKNISIRTTFIAGFPGETANEFKELCNWIKNNNLDWIGVFPYNNEPGTRSYELPQLQTQVINSRYKELINLQGMNMRKANSRFINQTIKTLISSDNGRLYGHAEHSAPEIDSQVRIKNLLEHLPGDFVKVKIKGIKGSDLYGEIV